jgi:Ca-activated chloride channel family protein
MVMRIRLAASNVARLGLVALLSIPLAASQSHLPNRGQKVYVVGVRDTRGLCCGTICSGSYPDRRPLLDRVVTDDALQSAARKEFRKEGRYVLVDSAENADFVFIIEGTYEPLLVERSSPARFYFSPVDLKPDRLTAVVAIAVPASIYRATPGDWPALFQARIWGAENGWSVLNASAGSPGVFQILVSPENLVKMFPDKTGKSPPPYSTLCVCPNWVSGALHAEFPTNSRATATPAASQPAQKNLVDDSSIKLEVDFVAVPVVASDENGKYVPGLRVADFHIFEDDVEQEIDRLVPVSEPLNAALLMDSSRSIPLKIDQIQQSALSFVESMRPEDHLMVASFDDRVHLDSEFSSDRIGLRRAILATRLGYTTRLYDAVDLILTERLDPISGRKAVVLFTDGVDTSSWLVDAAGSLEDLEESNVVLYAVQIDTRNDVTLQFPPGWTPQIAPPGMAKDEEMHAYGSQYLQDLASRSGGRLFHAATLGNSVEAFARVADELRHQYVLGYYPSNRARDGSYRRIRVTVDRPGVKIRARSGYRAGTPPSGK